MPDFHTDPIREERIRAVPSAYTRANLHMVASSFCVLSIRVARLGESEVVEARIESSLPHTPNTAFAIKGGWIVCTEPKAWRICSAPQRHRELMTKLACVSTAQVLVTDLSSANAILEVRGPASRRALAFGCPLDLHERVFKIGDAAGSRIRGLPLFVLKISDEPGFLVGCERPHALTVWERLVDAASD